MSKTEVLKFVVYVLLAGCVLSAVQNIYNKLVNIEHKVSVLSAQNERIQYILETAEVTQLQDN